MTDVTERLRAMAEWQVLDTHGQWARDGADEVDAHRARAEAAEAECARLRECLSRANVSLEASERARYAAEDERDDVLELVADDVVRAAQERDNRDADRLAKLVSLQVALADAELILEQRERQLTAALTFVAEERARCATVCREVVARYRSGACCCAECEGRGDGARGGGAVSARTRLAEDCSRRSSARPETHDADVAEVLSALDAAEADRDYWREQATGMAPSVDGMRALGTRIFPGGTGCVVDPERVVAEVERLRERVAEAEAEAIRWGDALVAIGEAIGLPGAASEEIVKGVLGMVSSAQRSAKP